MSAAPSNGPPRPLNVGDIVVCRNDLLGEWSAAQISDIDPRWKKAGVLELDWSGPEPSTADDLGVIKPLRLTHHSWNGQLSHTNCDWVLPRSYRVIGSMPLLHVQRANSYAGRWRVGDQLARQRAWDRGEHDWRDPGALELTPEELDRALADSAPPHNEVRSLKATGLSEVDAHRLTDIFPNLTSLTLGGSLGQLANAGELNRLSSLKALFISDLFGMTKADCVLPDEVPDLEYLDLHSVPHEYAIAMRALWRSQVANGTSVDISKARKPEWVQENLDNPLRDWDGREHITAARFKKAVAQFKKTRREVLAILGPQSDESTVARLMDLGREYALAFNRLDGRSPFIETEEREELFAALNAVVTEREQQLSRSLAAERSALLSAVEGARNW
ncbi:hypothetical protein [Arthrobacter sp. ISL-30]|uniref:hypothetical protein n=1 Tax=Arthrobacter sp. ISL-30 TaxID=2819109 RepID=UPI0027E00E47|nr:hypothetical protein [Arthrobacter sp. ISL-30]